MPRPKRIELDEGELRRMHGMGATLREKAAYFGCSRWTVSRRQRELGISSGPTGKKAPSFKGGERLDNRDGYVEVLTPGHPRANAEGYVRRSILMWERYHGRRFPKGRVPHHIDGDPANDSPRNVLSLLPAEHAFLHGFLRRKAGKGRG